LAARSNKQELTMSVTKIAGSALAAALFLLTLLPASALAAEPGKSSGTGKEEMLFWIEDAEKKLLELGEATPEAKFSSRPSKEVRSTGEVLLHAAGANFYIPSLFGFKPPAGMDRKNYDKSMTAKADILKAVKASFAHVKTALSGATAADLDKPLDLFGMKTTVRGGYMMLLAHSHEHLGQSIAYARGNGIVPPWTERRQKASAAKAKGAKSKD
jgi:uncharacterized damage-inducible protein DinB